MSTLEDTVPLKSNQDRHWSDGLLVPSEKWPSGPDQASRSKAAAKFLFKGSDNDNVAVFSHDQLTERNLDQVGDPLHFVERLVSSGRIAKQSQVIARKLAAGGVDPYLSGKDRVSMVGLVSGAVFELTKYRNVNIIPEVAQRNRAPLVSDFELFLLERPEVKRYARYAVVTSGKRFPIAAFSDRLKLFNDQLEDYWQLCRERGIEPLLVSLEFTIDGEDGFSVNLHANLVTWPKHAFGKAEWTAWLEKTRKHFGDPRAGTKEAISRDSGVIKDVKEIIKYVTKPGDILGMTAEDTAFLANALFRKQLVRPLGVFKEWRRSLKDSGQKTRFDHVTKELVRCQVAKRKRPDGEEPSEDEARQEVFDDIASEMKERRLQELARAGKLRDAPRTIENQILCRTLPQSRATLLAEPFVVVVNFTGDPSTENGRDGLAAIEARRRHHFKLLAEDGFTAEDIAAAGGSILDTRTIIPSAVAQTHAGLSPKRRKKLEDTLLVDRRLLEQYGPWHIEDRVRDMLNRFMPTEIHEWSFDVADVAALLREGLEKQEAFEEKVQACRRADLTFDDDLEFYLRRSKVIDRQVSYRRPQGSRGPVERVVDEVRVEWLSKVFFDFDTEDFAIPY